MRTLVDSLEAAATRGNGIVFVPDGNEPDQRLDFADLYARARRAAAYLIDRGVAPGDRVPVVLPTSPGFFAAFYGTMLAGAIPCPMALPAGFGQLEAYAQRFLATLRYLGARHAVIEEALAPIGMMLPEVDFLGGKTLASHTHEAARPLQDLAFIQCTSGSTGNPKGVMLSHANLLANIAQITRALAAGPGDVMVSWLPLFHDMGLIGTHMFPMTSGFDTVLMSPLRFQKRPATWLQAVSRYRGTLSSAPNFGYGYVTARVKDADLDGVDLSSWRVAACGAEPIDARTISAFHQRFRPFGLPTTASRPCYGLAEASLAISFHPLDAEFAADRIDRQALAAGVVEISDEGIDVARCGRAVEGTEVKIVDEAGTLLPERTIGRILVRGPSVMRGYYQLPEETAAVLSPDGWLDTGDLGYLADGEIAITGRAKDVIIVRGQKFPPTDFEWAAEQTPGVRRGAVVAFSAPGDGRELLYVAAETDAPEAELAAVRAELIARVAAKTGLKPDVVALSLERHAIPKTTSGKLQRRRTRELVLGGGSWKSS